MKMQRIASEEIDFLGIIKTDTEPVEKTRYSETMRQFDIRN
jgi:hypothetical protein